MDPLLLRGVVVPPQAMSMRAVRSGGPGGQNVNKVASKVELRVEMSLIRGLSTAAAARLRALARSHVDAEGRLLVSSQRSRDQHANLEDARRKVVAILLRALEEPKKRHATKPTRGSVERRIADKKWRAERKKSRGSLGPPRRGGD